MITHEEYEQLRWIEIDRFEIYNGAFIFISDEFEDKVIVAFSNTDVNELFSRAWQLFKTSHRIFFESI